MNDSLWAWAAIGGLGVLHGVNPAMGWLFAVALGMQEGRGRAVWRALVPLALGHALAIGAAVAVASAAGVALGGGTVRWLIGASLVGFGLWRLARSSHPRFGGMRVGMRDLTIWSALMATGHGAGLMVLPFVMGATPGLEEGLPEHGMHGAPVVQEAPAAHEHHSGRVAEPVGAPAGASAEAPGGHAGHGHHLELLAAGIGGWEQAAAPLIGLLATLVHTLTYLVAAGAMAWLVYRRFGLRLLRTHWINLDRVWAWALIVTGGVVPWL
jgi:hypothetical protein